MGKTLYFFKDLLLKNKYLLPAVASLISSAACALFLGLSTTNIFTLIFFFVLFFLYQHSFAINDQKINIVSSMLSILYSLSFFLYKFNDTMNEQGVFRIIVIITYLVGFFILFKNIVAFLYSKLVNKTFLVSDVSYVPKKPTLVFFVSMAVMLFCWLPYFLRNFPGDITTDSNNQLLQAAGIIPYSNAHPVAHTIFVELFYKLGMFLFNGNQTLAIATYSVCQMLLLSATFSYLILTLYKFKVRRGILVCLILFFALTSYHAVYSITLWKDIWFAAIVLIFSTTIWKILEYYNSGNRKFAWSHTIFFVIFGLGLCLFRSNGLYAYVALLPFLFIIFRKKNIYIAILSVLVLVAAFVVKGPIMSSLNIPSEFDTIESLSIPAQHIARAITDGAELTDDQYKLLSQVIDIDEIPKRYTPHVSDPIKNLVRETDNQEYLNEHKGEFLKLWIDIGIDNPRSYINAQIDQTYGYWYPDVQYWVYAPEFINRDMEYIKSPVLPESTYDFYTECMFAYKKFPFLGLLWSIGTFTWTALFSMGLCFLKKEKQFLAPYIPVIAVLATLIIATPVYAEFRYAYSLFTTLPLLFIIPFTTKINDGKNLNIQREDTINYENINDE